MRGAWRPALGGTSTSFRADGSHLNNRLVTPSDDA
jgi:hypothetical protein